MVMVAEGCRRRMAKCLPCPENQDAAWLQMVAQDSAQWALGVQHIVVMTEEPGHMVECQIVPWASLVVQKVVVVLVVKYQSRRHCS